MIFNRSLQSRGRWFYRLSAVAGIGLFAGCANPSTPFTDLEPVPIQITTTQSILLDMPLPPTPVPVAVYEFEDKTGQFKPGENTQSLSRAVSQGGASILAKALRDAGNGQWFRVLERTGLDNLLKERKIIREIRSRYLGETEINPNALPPLLFAGVILEGGIVGFDTNTLTGGLGARFLGIGGDVTYRQNTVTVNLRAVSVKTGEVLANVTTTKTIASIGLQGGAFRFVNFDELLEIESGITNNEPDTLALRRTIEKSVHSLIVEGSEAGLWEFADADAGAALVAARKAEQFGTPVLGEDPSDRSFATASKVAVSKVPSPSFDATEEAAEKSEVAAKPVAAAKSTVAAKPIAAEKSVAAAKPAPAAKPAVAAEPAAAEKPVAAAQPIAEVKPIVADKSAIAATPITVSAPLETVVDRTATARRAPKVLPSRRAPTVIAERTVENELAAPSIGAGVKAIDTRAIEPEQKAPGEVVASAAPLVSADAPIIIVGETE